MSVSYEDLQAFSEKSDENQCISKSFKKIFFSYTQYQKNRIRLINVWENVLDAKNFGVSRMRSDLVHENLAALTKAPVKAD